MSAARVPDQPTGLSQWYRDLVAEEVLEKRRNWRKKRPEHRKYPQPHKEFRAAIIMRR